MDKKKPILNSITEMSTSIKKPDFQGKKDKEIMKKAESLMENLFNELDEDDLIDERKERPKVNEFLNTKSTNFQGKSFLYSNNNGNLSNNKKATIFLNEYELNPSIAPKFSKKLETVNNSNKQTFNTNANLNKNKKNIIDDSDLKEYDINMDVELLNNNSNNNENQCLEYDISNSVDNPKKSEVQNLIHKNNKNILCGREKVVVPLQNIENSKRTRAEMESSVKTNTNILAGRSISNNKNQFSNDITPNKETYSNNRKNVDFCSNAVNSNYTPNKHMNTNENNNTSNDKNLQFNNQNNLNSNSNNRFSNNNNNNNNNFSNNNQNSIISLRNSSLNTLPLNPDKSLYVYWFDMVEEVIKTINYVIIFGKIYEPENQTFSSISIVLKNIDRVCYIIPKDDKINGGKYDLESVTNEFHELRKNKFGFINNVKTKNTKKKYCFELPIEHGFYDCLEIRYDSNLGQIPSNLNAKTFDYIFGKNSSLLETVLIEKNIRGPCWLKIEKDGFTDKCGNQHLTWSKYEIEIERYSKNISVFDSQISIPSHDPAESPIFNNPQFSYLKNTPPLNVFSISTKTIRINDQPEIYAICGTFINGYLLEDEKGENEKQSMVPIIVVRKVDHPHIKFEDLEKIKNKPEFIGALFMIAQNETAVINQFINKISQYDPDVIVGHKLYTEHFDFLINRINKLKITNWSKIGRLKRDRLPKYINVNNRDANISRLTTYGRLICDTLLSCKDVLRESNFELDFLSQKILGQPLFVLDPNKVFSKDYEIHDTNNNSAAGNSRLNTNKKSNLNDADSNSNIEKYEARNINKIELVKDLISGIFKESINTYLLMNKLSILSLTKELTNIGGNLWIRSLQNKRADRCEMLLMHEFHKNNFILPDRLTRIEKDELEENEDGNNFGDIKGKRKPQYSGGLVLEPKADLYDTIILLLDFNSLYPSIIQEFNICFTTVIRKPSQQFTYRDPINNKKEKTQGKNKKKFNVDEENEMDGESEMNTNDNKNKNENKNKEEDDDIVSEINNLIIDENEANINNFNLETIKKTNEKSILPGILENLVSKRKKIKEQMKYEKDKFKKDLLEIKQKAVKLSANSLYGYLGYKNSRFYAKAIAALITAIGRNILQNTVNLVRSQFSLEVIYGDTDSIMINTLLYELPAAMEIGEKIKIAVNKTYKLLEMELDGIFKTLLLLKKKKYASLKYEAPFGLNSKLVKEYKGLDLVRRDWCELSKQVGIYILDIILSGKNKDEMTIQILEFLKDVGEKLNKDIGKEADAYDYNLFEITKQITKNIEDYGDAKNLPHVRVAKRLRDKGYLSIKMNSFIPYIVCYEKQSEENFENNIETTMDIEGEKKEINKIKTKNLIPNNSKTLSDKCFHVSEILENPNLKVDVEWYKSNQIIASVSRLCKHISEINMHQLASNIGLDSNKYNSYLNNKNKNNELEELNSMMNFNQNNDKGFVKLQCKTGVQILCQNCNESFKIDKISSKYEHNVIQLYNCQKCHSLNQNYINNQNKILLQSKKNIMNYYKSVKTCLKCKSGTRLFLKQK